MAIVSDYLDDHRRVAFNEELRTKTQQNMSVFEPLIEKVDFKGKIQFFDSLGKAEFEEQTISGEETDVTHIERSRRALTAKKFYHKTDFDPDVDDMELMRAVNDPKVMQNIVSAWERRKDSVIIAGAIADVREGEAGENTVAFPTSQKIEAHNSEGLTIAKLTEAMDMFDDLNVPESERNIVAHPRDISFLLQSTEVTSSDYADVKALVYGKVGTLLGFNFHKCTEIKPDGSGERLAYAFRKPALKMGIKNGGLTIHWDVISQKSHILQLSVYGWCNAFREEDEQIITINNKRP